MGILQEEIMAYLEGSLETLSSSSVIVGLVTGGVLLYAAFWYNVHGYRRKCRSKVMLHGKTVIVTGASSGIRYETALELARRKARVIMACRNEMKTKNAIRDIQRRTGNSQVVYRHLDLSSLESVREFVRCSLDEEERLDILINNAGHFILFRLLAGLITDVSEDPSTLTKTKEGFDMTFGVNHFGHFLLTMLLVDKLKQSAPSRIINISSAAMEWQTSLDFTKVDENGNKYPRLQTYNASKLANVLFARELARRLEGTGVSVVSLNPGIIMHSQRQDTVPSLWQRLILKLMYPVTWLLVMSQKSGAQTTLHCALDNSIPPLSGSYFDNCQVRQGTPISNDMAIANKLWQVSCEATGYNDE